MKYYKLIEDDGGYAYRGFIIGKIYPGNFKEEHFCTVEEYATDSKYWQEVSPSEYYAQEDKMPEYFAIKRVGDNPLWQKYIDWLSKTYDVKWKGYNDCYYGYDGISGVRGVTYYINITSFSNNPVELTLEQWDKIVNKNKQEVMKGIIGYKLKEDCKQYRKAIEKLVDPMCLSSEIENLGAERNSLSIANLKQAGVLELWFKPVYKKKTLKFGGYDVTFKKVTSGVRISCNGETGTFSQLEAIYNYFKPNSTYFKFGSQEVKKVEYVDEAAWSLDEESTEPVSIKIGCTTGTWDEFVAIYNKAKSML